MPGNHFHQGCRIGNVRGKGSDFVERRGEGDQAVAGDAPVGGHQRGDAAEGAWLPDGAARVGAERRHGKPCRDDCGRAAAGASGHAVCGDGIPHGTVGGILVGTAHGELVAVGFPEDHRTGLLEALDRGGVVGGDVGFEDLRSAGGAHACCADDVFYGNRHTSQRGQRLAFRYGVIDAAGLLVSAVRGKREIGVEFGVALLDALVEVIGQLSCRDFLCGKGLAHGGDRPGRCGTHVSHRSITFGTRKNGFSASAAWARTASATSQRRSTSSRSSGWLSAPGAWAAGARKSP